MSTTINPSIDGVSDVAYNKDANGNVIGVGGISVPVVLLSSTPSGIPSGGTVTANGALSLTTALPRIYSGGIWLAFPAAALYGAGGVNGGGLASAAGLYWCVGRAW